MLRTVERIQGQIGHQVIRLVRLASSTAADVKPPVRRHRDAFSVLRALNSCVEPQLGLPDYRCLSEPWLGSSITMRTSLQAKAAGRNAARHVARHFLPNDMSALATEIPQIDTLMPLQTGESVRKELEDGIISETEAMDRLLLLLSPKETWSLYVNTKSKEIWTSDQLHRLLDLLCATNSGVGGSTFFANLPFVDRGNYPDPDELYFAEENRILSKRTQAARFAKDSVQESSSLEEEQLLEPNDNLLNLPPWLPTGPAEKLWTERADVLRSHAAYASIIRGAARFGNAQRAWQLAEEVGLKYLSLKALHSLLRCAPALDTPDVWPDIVRVLELISKPTTETFASALFALSKRSGQQNLLANALGLMKEARFLNIQPSLGMYANLINIVLDSRPMIKNKFGNTNAYRATELLGDMLVELERSWEVNPPSRADIFTLDDYNFFNIAMVCAMNEFNINIAKRLYTLVHYVNGDKRFLFAGSLDMRKFYSRYCAMMLRKGIDSLGSESEKTTQVAELFRKHRQVVLADQRLCGHLVWKLKSPIIAWTDLFGKLTAEPKQQEKEQEPKKEETVLDLQQANSIAFKTLADLLFDYAAILSRLPNKLPPPLVDAIFVFSNCDSWLSGRTLEGSSIRLISEGSAENAGKTAKAFLELIRSREQQIMLSNQFPLSSPELTGLIKMALMVTAFSADAVAVMKSGSLTEQTVHQRETNERALCTALDLLSCGQRHGVMTDIGAIEITRSLWLTGDGGDGQISDRLWSVLEYMSGLKYLSGQCLNHAFMDVLVDLLETARKDLQTSSEAHSSFNQQVSGQIVSSLTESDAATFSRHQIINALLVRIQDSRKFTNSKPQS